MLSLDELKTTVPVIIFGAGATSEALFYACQKNGITVSAFADTNITNINRVSGELFGLPIIYTSDLQAKFQDAAFCIAAAHIEDALRDLAGMGFRKWFAGGELLRDFDLSEGSYTRQTSLVEHSVASTVDSHFAFLHPEQLYLRSVDLIITERCSLKCADCANLMQFYKDPKNCDTTEVLSSITALCQNVDVVGEIRVIGGEPFMNKDAALIIRKCADQPQIRRVAVFTNATIPLRQEQLDLMRHRKVVFMITDYDELSRNHNRIIEALKANGIRWISQKAQGWTDCGHILPKQNRPPEEQRKFFENCCGNKLYTISDGKLYRCPFVANGVRLEAFPDFEDDRVVLLEGDVKKQLRRYTRNIPFLKACDYCPGRRLDDPVITPAIQTRKPVPYVKINS